MRGIFKIRFIHKEWAMLEKIKKHKKLTIAIVVIVIIAIVIGILVHRMRQSASEITQVDSGIQAFTLQKQDMSSSVSTSGTVESSNVTEVTTEVSSAIKELNVSLGDHVEKGQVLCTFDDEQIRQQIADLEKQNSAAKKASDSTKQKAQRAVETAQAQANAKAAAVAVAQNDYQTIQNLLGSSDQSAEEKASALAQAQANLQSAQSEYDAAQSAVASAQEALEDAAGTTADTGSSDLTKLYQQLNNLTVVAEQSGVITQLNVSKGSIPTNGSLMRIEDDSSLMVNVNIKEKDILKLAQGQKASITSDAIGSDQVFSGTVDKVVNFASKNAGSDGSSSSSGGYSATITLEPGTPLLLGMSVNVEIMLNEEGEQLAVPYDSVATDDDGNSYVFVGKEGKDGKYKIKKVIVTTGISNDYYTAVSSDDLKEGDSIINYPYDVSEGESYDLYFPEEQTDLGMSDDGAVTTFSTSN